MVFVGCPILSKLFTLVMEDTKPTLDFILLRLNIVVDNVFEVREMLNDGPTSP